MVPFFTMKGNQEHFQRVPSFRIFLLNSILTRNRTSASHALRDNDSNALKF